MPYIAEETYRWPERIGEDQLCEDESYSRYSSKLENRMVLI